MTTVKNYVKGLYHVTSDGWHALPLRRNFRRFYDRLPDQRDIFYMFFSTGLLQWVTRTLEFVPAEVNLVLLGSGLLPEEQEYARSLGLPFHHIAAKVDDKTVWEMLFSTGGFNFGWLDIDCFVLNPAVYRQMTEIADKTWLNCAWSFTTAGNRDVLLTYFCFVNRHAARDVMRQVPVSPCTYSYEPSLGGRAAPNAHARVLTGRQVAILHNLLPNSNGRPAYISEESYYDTLQVFQLVAEYLGYGIGKVRSLNPARQNFSEELVHIGKVSYYRKWKDRTSAVAQRVYALLLQADFALLSDLRGALPKLYTTLYEEIAAELARLGISTDSAQVKSQICQQLTARGVPRKTIARIVRLPEAQDKPGPAIPAAAS